MSKFKEEMLGHALFLGPSIILIFAGAAFWTPLAVPGVIIFAAWCLLSGVF